MMKAKVAGLLLSVVCGLFSTSVHADSGASEVRELSTCMDNSDRLYVVVLENGFTAYSYLTNALDPVEAKQREMHFSMLLSAYHSGKKVNLHTYNQGMTKCGHTGAGELSRVVFHTSYN